MELLLIRTLLTLHLTTPDELTVTVLRELAHYRVVAATATHQVTPIEPVAVLAALSAARAQGALGVVRLTEVGGILEVHEIFLRGPFHVGADRSELVLSAVETHEGGAVELLLESVADGPEGAHLPPADLHRAGTGNAMTLTHQIDLTACNLQTEK